MSAKAKSKAAAPVKSKKCNALNVGHRSCTCGGPECGENVSGRGAAKAGR